MIREMKKIGLLLVAAATLCLASCDKKESNSNEQTETTETAVVVEEPVAPAYVGTYEGTIPAADAAGFATKLTLREDGTYHYLSEAIEGKEESKTEADGVYSLLPNDVIEIVAPSTGDKTYFKVIDANSVALVADSTGVQAEGEMAQHYILTRVAE